MMNSAPSGMVKRVRSLSITKEDALHPMTTPSENTEQAIEIYAGTKNYWRLRRNILFNFEYHAKFDAFEIIGYDADTESHAPRLFVKASVIIRNIQNNELFKAEIEKRKEGLNRQTTSVKLTELDMRVKTMREFIHQYLLQRLDVVEDKQQPVLEKNIASEDTTEASSVSSANSDSNSNEDMVIEKQTVVIQSPPKYNGAFHLKFIPAGIDVLVPTILSSSMIKPPSTNNLMGMGQATSSSSSSSSSSVADETINLEPKYLDFECAGPPEGLVETHIPRRKKTR